LSVAASFEIGHARFLDERGKPTTDALPDFAQDPANLIPLYRLMVLTRTLDAKAVSLQRTGRMGTYASSLGQEVIGTSAGAAMRPEDVLFPTYREHGAQLARGVKLQEIFLYWGGDERGSHYEGPQADFPNCVPIATHLPQAAGAAYAFHLRHEKRCALAVCGDGATSKGDFYEALNFAGVWKLPLVVVIANNQWAISVPLRLQTACKTLAQKAVGCGVEGLQVDGNDFIAMRWAVEQALERARDGAGPTLIEAVTYRMHDHTTADDASRYRKDEEVSAHWKEDPIARARTFLGDAGAWTKEEEEALVKDCNEQVQAAIDGYLATPPAGPEAMFDYLYATLPEALAEQRAAAIAEAKRNA
jgi:2-oxoisovalerate dehydrogenase E1 component alpha subunit